MAFDAAGPAIPARRSRRNLAAGAEALQPAHRAGMLTPKCLAAALRDRPPTTTASTTRFAKIVRQRHPRRLLRAAEEHEL